LEKAAAVKRLLPAAAKDRIAARVTEIIPHGAFATCLGRRDNLIRR
jgi:hypothetical protein